MNINLEQFYTYKSLFAVRRTQTTSNIIEMKLKKITRLR